MYEWSRTFSPNQGLKNYSTEIANKYIIPICYWLQKNTSKTLPAKSIPCLLYTLALTQCVLNDIILLNNELVFEVTQSLVATKKNEKQSLQTIIHYLTRDNLVIAHRQCIANCVPAKAKDLKRNLNTFACSVC